MNQNRWFLTESALVALLCAQGSWRNTCSGVQCGQQWDAVPPLLWRGVNKTRVVLVSSSQIEGFFLRSGPHRGPHPFFKITVIKVKQNQSQPKPKIKTQSISHSIKNTNIKY